MNAALDWCDAPGVARPDSSEEPLLVARSLTAGYRGRAVVKGLDLRLRRGELWAVLGPNGAGKSTLARALLGLLPLLSGEVTLKGARLATYSRTQLARVLAWVPQVSDVGGGFTGLELALLGRSPHLGAFGLPSQGDVARAEQALAQLGISHLGPTPCNEVSGGEHRLLWLARAFVQSPEVLVLDEPTAFLDLKHQVEALTELRARVDAGLLAVAVLHDVNLAEAFADRVLLLRAGEVLAQGTPAEVLQPGTLEALYDLPMTRAVSEAGQALFAPRRAKG